MSGRLPVVLAVAVAIGLPARGDIAQLSPAVINALTQIDVVPSRQQLDAVHGNDALAAIANLRAIALAEGAVDVGVQLRAIRALPQYCQPCTTDHDAHTALTTLAALPRYRDARAGSDVLVLRAAIEALGVLRLPDDLTLLAPRLEHPVRDIRAATASALRDLGNTQAIVPLRARYQQEQVAQVRLAISDALRVLGQPVP